MKLACKLSNQFLHFWVFVSIALGGNLSVFEKNKLTLSSQSPPSEIGKLAQVAAENKDFILADSLYQSVHPKAVDRETYNIVYPSSKLNLQLDRIEQVLATQPLYRDALLEKSALLYQLKNDQEIVSVLEKLKYLDPNHKAVIEAINKLQS